MTTNAEQEKSNTGAMDLTEYLEPEQRENSVSWLSRRFPDISQDNILEKYANIEIQYKRRKKTEKAKAARLALKLVAKKKTALAILKEVEHSGLVPGHLIPAILNVAQNITPGATVSAKELVELAGRKPMTITDKWWVENFPRILDVCSLTLKKSKTERRFLDIQELEEKCFLMTFICHKLGDTVYSSADRITGKIIKNDPFIERTSKGEVIMYERPHETPEGKEAARKAATAKYMQMMKTEEEKYSLAQQYDEGSIDQYTRSLTTYKKPVYIFGVFLFLAVLAVAAEMNGKTDINPSLSVENASVFSRDDFSYLADENYE